VEERLKRINELVLKNGYMSVIDLAAQLSVSDMTVRRDLEKLELEGLISRTHGGAYTKQAGVVIDYHVRATVHPEEKESIGKLAYSLINPGESIFIDAGSTASFLALAIDDRKRLTVVTHSLVVAEALLNKVNVDAILLGGKVHSLTRSMIGPLAEEAVGRFKYTKSFLGTSGINLSEGFTASTLEEIPIKKTASENSKQVIVLADSTKLHTQGLSLFLNFCKVNMVITDWGMGEDDRKVLEKEGIRVLCAKCGGGNGVLL
jgi:DeoR/GlpR family transcriptional regulator of sugar metabolism